MTKSEPAPPGLAAVEALLHHAYIGAPGAALRREDRKKALELVGLLEWIVRVLPRRPGRSLSIVDAAAGKGYVGLAIGALLLAPRQQTGTIYAIEQVEARLRQIEAAFSVAAPAGVRLIGAAASLADRAAWPSARPDLVVALHACGAATDEAIAGAVASSARHVLLAPCCVAADLPATLRATAEAERLGLPRAAELRRPFVETLVLAERVRALEAGGYSVTVPTFVPPTVTPHHRLLYGRRR